jgi:hypothetical protein
MYVYFYSLHVSGSHVPIIRRIVSIRHLVYATLYRWLFGVHTCTPNGHLYSMTYTNVVLIQLILLMMAHGHPKHVENRNKHTWKRIVCHVGYLQGVKVGLHVPECFMKYHSQWPEINKINSTKYKSINKNNKYVILMFLTKIVHVLHTNNSTVL